MSLSLKERLDQDLKAAMQAKAQVRLDTIRQVKSVIRYKEVELKRPCTEDEYLKTIATLVKQRREAITQFEQGGRADLAAKEQAELQILEAYLPQQLSEAELVALVRAAITAEGATTAKDMGRVMKALQPQLAGRADGAVVSRLVKQALGAV